MISLLERGRVEQMSLRTLRRVLLALEARGELEIRWRGGHLDRLLDERHAVLVGGIVNELASFGWVTAVVVTYARFGERGSIDVLAYRPDRTALLVVEVKSELTSLEETLRRLDEKVRLGPTIAAERLGWVARSTSQAAGASGVDRGPGTTVATRRRPRCDASGPRARVAAVAA